MDLSFGDRGAKRKQEASGLQPPIPEVAQQSRSESRAAIVIMPRQPRYTQMVKKEPAPSPPPSPPERKRFTDVVVDLKHQEEGQI